MTVYLAASASAGQQLVTRRVRQGINSANDLTTAGQIQDFVQRHPYVSPVTTTRWRMLCCNRGGRSDTSGAGTVTLTGVAFGPSSLPVARWDGAYASAPTSVGAGGTVLDGVNDTQIVPWQTDSALQMIAGKRYTFSEGFTGNAANQMPIDSGGQMGPWLWSSGAGKAATFAQQAATASDAAYSMLDIRIEYEYQCPATAPLGVVLCADSIAAGTSDIGAGGASTGASLHEAWPGAAAMRLGFPIINNGMSSATTVQFAEAVTKWRIARLGIGTDGITVPDFAIITIGYNDINSSGTFQADYRTCMAHARTLGIDRVYVATVIPNGVVQAARDTNNAWIRTLPYGATGLLDFNMALGLQADRKSPDSIYVPFPPHPIPAGHARMAELVVGAFR